MHNPWVLVTVWVIRTVASGEKLRVTCLSAQGSAGNGRLGLTTTWGNLAENRFFSVTSTHASRIFWSGNMGIVKDKESQAGWTPPRIKKPSQLHSLPLAQRKKPVPCSTLFLDSWGSCSVTQFLLESTCIRKQRLCWSKENQNRYVCICHLTEANKDLKAEIFKGKKEKLQTPSASFLVDHFLRCFYPSPALPRQTKYRHFSS